MTTLKCHSEQSEESFFKAFSLNGSVFTKMSRYQKMSVLAGTDGERIIR
jgi:hypothetical protein